MRAPSGWRTAVRRWCLRHLQLLPLLLLVAGAVLDYNTPPHFSAEAFYTAAPMTAAALLSLRATILSGIGTCAADFALLTHFGFIEDSGGRSELAAVATVSAFAVVVNRLMYYSDVRLQSARRVALAVQRAVLPHPPTAIGPLRIAVRYQSAVKDAQIGGDLYGVLDTPYGVRCLVGDVRGKGMEAVKAVDVALGGRSGRPPRRSPRSYGSRTGWTGHCCGRRSGVRGRSRPKGSSPPCSPRSRTPATSCGWSIAAIPRPCCCAVAGCAAWNRPS
ncbi:hypothetical protein GCM10020000_75030 [Streptomyces olivoverticillatus]